MPINCFFSLVKLLLVVQQQASFVLLLQNSKTLVSAFLSILHSLANHLVNTSSEIPWKKLKIYLEGCEEMLQLNL